MIWIIVEHFHTKNFLKEFSQSQVQAFKARYRAVVNLVKNWELFLKRS
jgi:hypothetical protein